MSRSRVYFDFFLGCHANVKREKEKRGKKSEVKQIEEQRKEKRTLEFLCVCACACRNAKKNFFVMGKRQREIREGRRECRHPAKRKVEGRSEHEWCSDLRLHSLR